MFFVWPFWRRFSLILVPIFYWKTNFCFIHLPFSSRYRVGRCMIQVPWGNQVWTATVQFEKQTSSGPPEEYLRKPIVSWETSGRYTFACWLSAYLTRGVAQVKRKGWSSFLRPLREHFVNTSRTLRDCLANGVVSAPDRLTSDAQANQDFMTTSPQVRNQFECLGQSSYQPCAVRLDDPLGKRCATINTRFKTRFLIKK